MNIQVPFSCIDRELYFPAMEFKQLADKKVWELDFVTPKGDNGDDFRVEGRSTEADFSSSEATQYHAGSREMGSIPRNGFILG